MGRYSTSDVLQMMKMYKDNKQELQEKQRDYIMGLSSRGMVARYGWEATMPVGIGGGHSDPVADHVLSREDMDLKIMLLENYTRYLENRQFRIMDDRRAMIYSLRLQGYSVSRMGVITGYSERKIYRLLRECAELIIGEGE